jgi:polysaccharide pyruvyl transferase CsaB
MKRVVVSGYYGFGNLGDEAVLEALIGAVSDATDGQVRFTILSSRPEWTSRRYQVEAVSRTHLPSLIRALRASDLLISGGGSLLQDVTGPATIPYYLGIVRLAQIMGVPTVIYAQGIGPVKRKLFYPAIRSVFKRADYISVRDADSAGLLSEMGVEQPVEIAADPVFALHPPVGGNGGGNTGDAGMGERPVIVSLRPWPQMSERVVPDVAGLLDACIERGETVRLLPMQEAADRPVLEAVAERMRHGKQVGWVEGDMQPSLLMGRIGGARLVLGMRLHALIFAAAQGVPFIPLSYDPKVDHLIKRLDYPLEALDVETLAEGALEALAEKALAAADELRSQLMASRERLMEAARRPAQAVARILGLGGN